MYIAASKPSLQFYASELLSSQAGHIANLAPWFLLTFNTFALSSSKAVNWSFWPTGTTVVSGILNHYKPLVVGNLGLMKISLLPDTILNILRSQEQIGEQ